MMLCVCLTQVNLVDSNFHMSLVSFQSPLKEAGEGLKEALALCTPPPPRAPRNQNPFSV